ARPPAALARRPEPLLRWPNRRRGLPDRTTPESPPTSACWNSQEQRAHAPAMRPRSRDADPDRLDDISPASRIALDQAAELLGYGDRDPERLEARCEFLRLENGF